MFFSPPLDSPVVPPFITTAAASCNTFAMNHGEDVATPAAAAYLLHILAALTTFPPHLAAIAKGLARDITALRRQAADWRVRGDAVPLLDTQWLLGVLLAEHRVVLEKELQGQMRHLLWLLQQLEDEERAWASQPPLHRRTTPSALVLAKLPELDQGLSSALNAPNPGPAGADEAASEARSNIEERLVRLTDVLERILVEASAPSTPPPAPTRLAWPRSRRTGAVQVDTPAPTAAQDQPAATAPTGRNSRHPNPRDARSRQPTTPKPPHPRFHRYYVPKPNPRPVYWPAGGSSSANRRAAAEHLAGNYWRVNYPAPANYW